MPKAEVFTIPAATALNLQQINLAISMINVELAKLQTVAARVGKLEQDVITLARRIQLTKEQQAHASAQVS